MVPLPLLFSSGREVQALGDGLDWLPEPTSGRALPQSFLRPASEHMSRVLSPISPEMLAPFPQLVLSHGRHPAFSEGLCREPYGH